MIDAKLFYRYYVGEGMSCDIHETMTKITKDKEKILQTHLDNVYPIKRTSTGYYTKLNPKDRNHSGKISAKTKEDLEAKIIAYYLEIQNKSYTFKQIMDFVVEEYKSTNQEPTGIRHRQALSKYFEEFMELEVSKLTQKQLEEKLKALITEGIKEKDFSKATGVLNQINYYCQENNIACIDITNIIKAWKKKKLTGKHVFEQVNRVTKNLVFTEAETKELLRHALIHPNFKSLFVGLALTTGCRCGELLCMSYDNIDLDTNYFHVYEIEDCHTKAIKPYTKNNEDREVYLNANARQLLNELLRLRKHYKIKSRYLFLNDNAEDGKLHARAVDDYLRQLQIKLEFDETKELRSLHDCRRTYATLQFLADVNIKHIQRQLGHSSIKQTEDYINEIIDVRKRAVELEKGAMDLSA